MSLKEATWEAHKRAESTEFSKLLLSGNISKELYANYLYQMLLVYNGLERYAGVVGLLNGLEGIERSHAIYQDFVELAGKNYNNNWLESSKRYYTHICELYNDPEKHKLLMAHVYVRHMGDMYGGQMIAQKCPGSGRFYKFNNRSDMIAKIRERLTDDLADEANLAFDFNTEIMTELMRA